jgi:hypothetical protein
MAIMSSAPESAPSVLVAPTPPKRKLWKWSLAAAGLFLIFLMWRCGSALIEGREFSNQAVGRFHERFNRGQYNEIWEASDEDFKTPQTESEWEALMDGVHRKLGDAGPVYFHHINANANTDGTFVTVVYNTTFARGWAVETFIWRKDNGEFKLHGYNVQSKALVLN